MSPFFYFYRLTQGEGFLYEFINFLKFQIQKILNLGNRLTRKWKIKKYYKNHDKIKIQIGSGMHLLKGYLNTDLFGRIPINITKKLPFPSNSIDLIFSHGVVEHIYYRQFKSYLRDSCRVLKKGGIQIIITPSIERLIKTLYGDDEIKQPYLKSHEKLQYHRHLGEGKLDAATFLNRMFHIYYMHRWIYDYESLNKLAKNANYSKTGVYPDLEIQDDGIQEFIRNKGKKAIFKGEMEVYLLIK